MNRRELVALALVAPFARSAKMIRLRAPQIRVFADLKHTGRLAGPVNARAITAADFGIAVPLPTLAADQELLITEGPEKQDISSRLGLLRIETSEARSQIVVSVAGEGAGAFPLYKRRGWLASHYRKRTDELDARDRRARKPRHWDRRRAAGGD